jgi:hypothetical protein
MTDEAVTEVRMREPVRESRPAAVVSAEEFEAYRSYLDLVAHARDYAETAARRRLGLAEQLMIVVDQMWSMLPQERPVELDGRIAQLRNYINTEHALNGRRRA